MAIKICRPKSLPFEKLVAADRRALQINPENASVSRVIERTPIGRRGGLKRIAVVIARRWPATGVRLSVSFLDNPSVALRARILRHMNAWGREANVLFSETDGVGEVRIARFDEPEDMAGYWSYVGTEILEAPEDEPTLNLEGFTMGESDAEFRRVVRHEAGHTLGFDHEHMRTEIVNGIDREKAFAYFDRTEGWTRKETKEQVLTPLAKNSVMGTTEADPLSIMCYQLPGSIMKNRKPVKGGLDINPTDYRFAAALYPKPDGRSTDTPERRAAETSRLVVTPHPVVARGGDEGNDTFELVIMDEFDSGINPEPDSESKPKYAQVFASYCGARVTTLMRLNTDKDKGEEATGFGEIISVHSRILRYTRREGGSLPTDKEMIAFGKQLFDTLFQGDVRRLYDEARTRQRNRLDIVLTSMIPWIAEKPWEFAYDEGRQSYLATEETHFIRNVLTKVPADPVFTSDGPLRILVASAQPVGSGMLSIEQEVAVIQRGFKPLMDAKLVEIETLARATPSMIHDKLTTGSYQVVHFIGHGIYDQEREEGCLLFVNEYGGEYRLGERSVREIFRGRGLSLVFLNSCESGRGGRGSERGFNTGVAQSLVARGLPAVVANQYSVLDTSATSFAQKFYWCLGQGMSLGQAAREARIAVNYLLYGEPIDWAIPVLYARNPDARLCTPPTTPVSMATPGVRGTATASRSTARNVARIAVWDMDNVFPGLDKTVKKMNEAQTAFGFELVDLSVPLGVWDIEETEGTTYLVAEMLAKRLQKMPVELGVEILTCVTRHWMRDQETLNIYLWWSEDRKPPIIIFSIAGFDDLPPAGAETDRALANALVTGLAGFYGEVDTHTDGKRDCPLAYDGSRDFNLLVGRQEFDQDCVSRLQPKLGEKFAALEALLKTFP